MDPLSGEDKIRLMRNNNRLYPTPKTYNIVYINKLTPTSCQCHKIEKLDLILIIEANWGRQYGLLACLLLNSL